MVSAHTAHSMRQHKLASRRFALDKESFVYTYRPPFKGVLHRDHVPATVGLMGALAVFALLSLQMALTPFIALEHQTIAYRQQTESYLASIDVEPSTQYLAASNITTEKQSNEENLATNIFSQNTKYPHRLSEASQIPNTNTRVLGASTSKLSFSFFDAIKASIGDLFSWLPFWKKTDQKQAEVFDMTPVCTGMYCNYNKSKDYVGDNCIGNYIGSVYYCSKNYYQTESACSNEGYSIFYGNTRAESWKVTTIDNQVSCKDAPGSACKNIRYFLHASSTPDNPEAKIYPNKTYDLIIGRWEATNCNGNWDNVNVTLDGVNQGVQLCDLDGRACEYYYHTTINSGSVGTHTLQFTVNNGACGCNTMAFETVAPPSTCTVGAPTNSTATVDGNTVNFTWGAGTNADRYILEVRKKGELAGCHLDANGTNYCCTTQPATGQSSCSTKLSDRVGSTISFDDHGITTLSKSLVMGPGSYQWEIRSANDVDANTKCFSPIASPIREFTVAASTNPCNRCSIMYENMRTQWTATDCTQDPPAGTTITRTYDASCHIAASELPKQCSRCSITNAGEQTWWKLETGKTCSDNPTAATTVYRAPNPTCTIEAGKCVIGGGTWKFLPSPCEGTCGTPDPNRQCPMVMTLGCDCGENKCWNSSSSSCTINNPPAPTINPSAAMDCDVDGEFIKINYTEVPAAVGYLMERKTGDTGTYTTVGTYLKANGFNTGTVVVGLSPTYRQQPNTKYCYRMRAMGKADDTVNHLSPYSNEYCTSCDACTCTASVNPTTGTSATDFNYSVTRTNCSDYRRDYTAVTWQHDAGATVPTGTTTKYTTAGVKTSTAKIKDTRAVCTVNNTVTTVVPSPVGTPIPLVCNKIDNETTCGNRSECAWDKNRNKCLRKGDISGPIPGTPDGKVDVLDLTYLLKNWNQYGITMLHTILKNWYSGV